MYTAAFFLMCLTISAGQSINQDDACSTVQVECICGTGENSRALFLELQRSAIPDPQTGIMKCLLIPDPQEACANYSCLFAETDKLRLVGSYPDGHRFNRETEPCYVPALAHATIRCNQWPSWINCSIHCLAGYALQYPTDSFTIRSTTVTCKTDEDVWMPHKFTDCKPYLNCKTRLVRPGDMQCKQPYEGAYYCDIACFPYDEFEATPLQRYECTDENFGRSLPHCVTLQDKLVLLKKPN